MLQPFIEMVLFSVVLHQLPSVCVFLHLPVDHIALIIELLGKVPRKLILAGKYSKEFFTKKGKHTHLATSCLLWLNLVSLSKYAQLFGAEVSISD